MRLRTNGPTEMGLYRTPSRRITGGPSRPLDTVAKG
jgi:hypothetical protein